MLGHKLGQIYRDRFDTWVTVRSSYRDYDRYSLFDSEHTIGDVDAMDFETVTRAFQAARPDVVINAIGIIKQLPAAEDHVVALTINSLFPHRLASLCASVGCRLITLSTDCVFNGKKGMYTEDDVPDAEDLYGRTKFLGEVDDENCLTLRTSIIGRELESSHSLVEWFLSNQGGSVKGFTKAIYSGFPTVTMAGIMAKVIEDHKELNGVYQVSTDPISKYELLLLMRDAYGVSIEVIPEHDYQIDRSLVSTRFREATGFRPETWPDMIQAMAADPTPYDEWRRTSGPKR
jgi:dTDP-4-dehydrorhamnose reductase